MSDKLPSCMMPDGADPCEAYQELYMENKVLREALDMTNSVLSKSFTQNDVDMLRQAISEALAK